MTTVKIADLKNNLSRHLAHVRQGGELTVLDRDTPVARIVPFAPRPAGGGRTARAQAGQQQESAARLDALQRLGVVGPGDPRGLADWVRTHEPLKLPKGAPRATDLLIQMRRESTR